MSATFNIQLPYMKTLMFVLVSLLGVINPKNHPIENGISGAWKTMHPDGEILMIVADNYVAITAYNVAEKKFIYSKGGVLKVNGSTATLKTEFNSQNRDQVGKEGKVSINISGNELTTNIDGSQKKWQKIDSATTALTGCWRINRRSNNGQMHEMKLRPRRTLKLLSGSKFQWMAINIETGEFSGTGGGSYTFKDGKYTEHIEFFSRDSNRVGASLTFDGKVEDGTWFHQGRSSKGDPIDEQWIKLNSGK